MVKCSRRDLIKTIPFIPLAFTGVSYPFSIYLPTDCFDCELSLCICCEKFSCWISTKVKYWFPVGFLEANSTCEFMSSLIPFVGSLIESPLKAICNSIPFITDAKLTQNYPTANVSQDYMRVHARWYALPEQLQKWVEMVLTTIHFCPCIGLGDIFGSMFENIPVVSEGLEALEKLNNTVRNLEERVRKAMSPVLEKLKGYLPSGYGDTGRMKDILKEVALLQEYVPVWFTELVSPIWLIDVLSPDNKFTPAIANAIVNFIQSQNPPLGVLACPHLANAIAPILSRFVNTSLLDLSFLCVGYWGRGYPRIGVVRHDDPSIAELLALARFHHLFSHTYPIIKPKFTMNPSKMKYQIWKPQKTDCFRIGYWGIPDIYDLKDISDAQSFTKKLERIGWESFKHVLTEAIEKGRRRMFVIIWYRKSKCCC